MSNPISSSTLRKVWDLLTPPERRGAVGLFGLIFVGMLLETFGVGMVVPATALLAQTDIVATYPWLAPYMDALGRPSQQTLVIGGMIALVAIYLVKALFLAVITWRQTRFTFAVRTELSQRLFTIYLYQPYTFHLQRNSAQLIRNVINEVGVFCGNGLMQAVLLLTEALVFAGVCVLLLAVEPIGAFIVVGLLGATIAGAHYFTRGRVTRWGHARHLHDALRVQHLQQGLGGAKDVKLLGREVEFLDQYRVHNVQSARVEGLHSIMQQLPRVWLELLAVSGLAILVIGMLARGRSLAAVLPILGLFAAAAFRMMPSITRILGAIQSLRYCVAVVDTLHAECNLPMPRIDERTGASRRFESQVELRGIRYAYSGSERPALADVSIVLRRGESLGIVGTSGAGKSTLVDVMLGLLKPDAGEVRVDGVNVEHDMRGWQAQIGYVPQSIFLTDDSIRRNVAFGVANDRIDEAAVWRSLRAAQLADFVKSLPDGLDTVVGERGVRLSGGQRQRIGIARALYHDPPVFVLDEATSSLDVATEAGVMEAVIALHGKKTLLIVAHRFSTVRNCDRLVRLEHGRVVDEGVADAVLAKVGGRVNDAGALSVHAG